MNLTIRPAVPGDESLILGFIRELAAYEKLSHEVVATDEHLSRTLFSETPKVFALIAEDEGEAIGFALYFFNYSTFLGKHGLYLEDLYVRESARGAGAGKALLSALARVALENDCGRMEWSVLDWNAPAIAFYKSLGAAPMDEWTVYRLTGASLEHLAKGAE
ncbi:N-acetyltransferase family protein [Hyphococcus sp.]|jgi:GNAT superfamily N-acetyltransferase|uniref:GNAT family N-acetyltransferase n=1 Tax=Hyphococcus sp. TaxID=2038636 RepID=UPI003D0E0988